MIGTFKLFLEGDASEEAMVVDTMLRIKHTTEQMPFGYVWRHTDEELVNWLKILFQHDKHVSTPHVLAEASLNTKSHIQGGVYKIEFYYSPQMPGYYGLYKMVIGYPESTLGRTINSEQYKFMHAYYTKISDYSTILQMEATDVLLYFQQHNFNKVILPSNLEQIERHWMVCREIANIVNPYDINELISTFEKVGMSKAEIIRLKMKWGIQVRPDEIDDATMIDLL
jgi:hypothetical protein